MPVNSILGASLAGLTTVCHEEGHQNCVKNRRNSYISPKEKPPPTVKADEGSHRRPKPRLVRVKFSFWDVCTNYGFDLDENPANPMP